MTHWLIWIGCGIGALIVAATLIEAYLKRNTKRRLSDMRPDPEKLKRRPWEVDGVTRIDKTRADIGVATWKNREGK